MTNKWCHLVIFQIKVKHNIYLVTSQVFSTSSKMIKQNVLEQVTQLKLYTITINLYNGSIYTSQMMFSKSSSLGICTMLEQSKRKIASSNSSSSGSSTMFGCLSQYGSSLLYLTLNFYLSHDWQLLPF